MIKTKKIKVGEGDYEAKELTVGQLDQVLNDCTEDRVLDRYYQSIHPDVTAALVAMATAIDQETQAGFSPDHLAQVVEAVIEVNSSFLSRIKQAAEVAVAKQATR